MQGADPLDPVCADRPPEPAIPTLHDGIAGLRIARAGGYFRAVRRPRRWRRWTASPRRWSAGAEIELPEAARARAAAYVITASEGAALHLHAPAHPRRRTSIRTCATG